MGADRVVVCYGVRYSLGLDGALPDGLLTALEAGAESRLIAARRAGLKAYWGKVTDGGEYFLLIGTMLGSFGIEGSEHLLASDEELTEVAKLTRERLARAGLRGVAGLHVQLEAQY
jgi:hypothetical protein